MSKVILKNLSRAASAVDLSTFRGVTKPIKALQEFLSGLRAGDIIKVEINDENTFFEMRGRNDQIFNNRKCYNGLVICITEPDPEEGIYDYYFRLDCGIEVQLPDKPDVRMVEVGFQMAVMRWINKPESYMVEVYNNGRPYCSYLVDETMVKVVSPEAESE